MGCRSLTRGPPLRRQFAGMAPLKLIGFAAGLLLCCVGLGLLTFASGDGEAVEEDEPPPLPEGQKPAGRAKSVGVLPQPNRAHL